MRPLRTKQDILAFVKTLEGVEFPENAHITIVVKEDEFDELIVRGIGKAIDMDTIHHLSDDKVYKIIRSKRSESNQIEDYQGPQLFL